MKFSYGFTLCNSNTCTKDQLMTEADNNMYADKNRHKLNSSS